MTDLVNSTLAHAGGLLRRRATSVRELVEATLRQIEDTESAVHAYAHVAPEAALATADRLDAELRQGDDRGPLHGIPVAVKDVCHTADMPTAAGSRVLAGFTPERDAAVVRSLRAAGAVVVGKTVTHEFAYGQNTPPTRNAWDTSCYPGGSSAGSGVAVATRSAFAAIGTDTGGSIRIPAALNGVVGLKPTYGRVSTRGVVPLSPSLDHVGPMARTVEDCALLFDAIAGHDPDDPVSINEPVRSSATGLDRAIEGTVIGIERTFFFGDAIDPEVSEAVSSAFADLVDHGARVVEIDLPELHIMPTAAFTLMLTEASRYHRRLLVERPQDYEPGTRLILELGAILPDDLYPRAQRARIALKDAMHSAFDLHALDALIAPATLRTTVPIEELSTELVPKHDGTIALSEFVRQSFPANLTGQPALSIPCGFSRAGLPIGFQLLGRPFAEDALFRIGRVYERCHDWHARVPLIAACGPERRQSRT